MSPVAESIGREVVEVVEVVEVILVQGSFHKCRWCLDVRPERPGAQPDVASSSASVA